jgi:hypothetical protein
VEKSKIIYVLALLVTVFSILSCQRSASSKTETTGDSTATPITKSTENKLTAEEKAAGWELLFDGSTLQGWKRFNHDTIGPLWTVKEGAIVCDGEGLAENPATMSGSLMTTKQFGNFELTAEWKISPGGNSGILYHIIEHPKYKHDYETGPEVQVMDDAGWKGDKLKEAQKAGSNYDMFEAPTSKKVMPAGEWNLVKIVYNYGHVEHWLNGEKIVEFEEGSPEYNARYRKSKWTKYPDWNRSKTGAISLQDHGAPVYFRNIKIRAF